MLKRVPPIFVSHPGPELAVDVAAGAELAAWARELPRPRGVLVVSSHWHADTLTRGTTSRRPDLLFDADTDANPGAAIRIGYPAPGAPELAYDVASLLPLDPSRRGWDHGVWAPLVHMFPSAELPVLQLSLVTGATPRTLFEIGRRLGVLPSRGYLVLGAGAITDNPSELAPQKDAPVAEWARAFDGWVANLLADFAIDELFAWRRRAPNARRAHPNAKGLEPLFVVAGVASLDEHAVGFPIRGFEHGSFSRRCVQFGRS